MLWSNRSRQCFLTKGAWYVTPNPNASQNELSQSSGTESARPLSASAPETAGVELEGSHRNTRVSEWAGQDYTGILTFLSVCIKFKYILCLEQYKYIQEHYYSTKQTLLLILLSRMPLQRCSGCVRATLGWQMFICSLVSGVQPL